MPAVDPMIKNPKRNKKIAALTPFMAGGVLFFPYECLMKADGVLFFIYKSPADIFGVLENISKCPMKVDGVLQMISKSPSGTDGVLSVFGKSPVRGNKCQKVLGLILFERVTRLLEPDLAGKSCFKTTAVKKTDNGRFKMMGLH